MLEMSGQWYARSAVLLTKKSMSGNVDRAKCREGDRISDIICRYISFGHMESLQNPLCVFLLSGDDAL